MMPTNRWQAADFLMHIGNSWRFIRLLRTAALWLEGR